MESVQTPEKHITEGSYEQTTPLILPVFFSSCLVSFFFFFFFFFFLPRPRIVLIDVSPIAFKYPVNENCNLSTYFCTQRCFPLILIGLIKRNQCANSFVELPDGNEPFERCPRVIGWCSMAIDFILTSGDLGWNGGILANDYPSLSVFTRENFSTIRSWSCYDRIRVLLD